MKKVLISPFFIIFAIWFFFSAQYFFQQKVPFPSSYQVNFFSPWNAYPEFASPYKNEATPDVIGQIYPWREFTVETWKSGQVPLWNPYSFSGTFHLANYQSAVFSPLNIGFFIFPFVEWWSILILLQPLLAGFFILLYVRTLKFSYFSQIISAVSFMFCGFITTWMMYGTLGYAILYLPLSLFAIEKYLNSNKTIFLFLLFLSIPLSFFSGHFQISLYFLLFVIYYIIVRGFQTKKKGQSIAIFLAVTFGVLSSSIQLFPSIEAYSQSLRSGIFQKTETIPWMYLPTFIAPDFFGNPVTRNAWFGHYAEWNAFIGIIPLFFTIYSFSRIRKREIFVFSVPIFISLLLAFSSPLLDLLIFLKIPVLSTSAASRIIVIFSFCASILAGYGFMSFTKDLQERKYRNTLFVVGIFIFFFSFLWFVVASKQFLDTEKLSIAFSNLRFPSSIFASFIGLLFLLILIKRKGLRNVFLFLIIGLLIFDILRFARKWQPFEPKNLVFAPTKLSQFYNSLPNDNYRVFKNSGAEGIMFNRLQGVEGYDAVYIKRYGDFISSLRTGIYDSSTRSVVAFPKDSPYATSSANFLGIKYIVHKITDGQNVWEFPFWKYDPESLTSLYDDGYYQVLENKNVFPRAFLVKNVIKESEPQKILDIMFSSNTDLLKTAVVEEPLKRDIKLGTGSAEIVKYTPNEVIIVTNANDTSFLVLTDSYNQGWNAYINGEKTKNFRTDFSFRGVIVPKGKSEVIFKYEPPSFRYGILASIIGIIGITIVSILKKKNIY